MSSQHSTFFKSFVEYHQKHYTKEEMSKRKRVEEEEEETEPVKKKQKIEGSLDNPFDPATQYKFISWNVNGLNAFSKKMVPRDEDEDDDDEEEEDSEEKTWAQYLVERESPSAIVLQEIKLSSKKQVKNYTNLFPGYISFFNISTVKGLHGTALYLKENYYQTIVKSKPDFGIDGCPDHNNEGRTITCEFPELFLVNNYVPNSGSQFKRLDYRVDEWDEDLQEYLLDLEKEKNIVWCGDLNCAILDIDVHNPKRQKSAGFHPRERKSFSKFLEENDLVDTFRHFHPEKENCWTYWGYRYGMRKKDKGWRLDYFIVSEDLKDKVVDSYILKDYYGSDHCPIGLIINK